MKIAFYILLIVAVIAGGIYAWFYFSDSNVKSNNVNSSPATSTETNPISQMPVNYSIADTFPKTETISIGTGNGAVEVKNFYKKIVDTEEGFVIMADNENYQISYERSTSVFYIDLRTETVLQTKAESDFLSVLGISQQDACKLNVLVFHAGQSNGTNLSFCTN
ncbi:MAG: hypothetical protein Q8Q17_01815 [bacterium]|nr:hypothetical protein [bacterium]